MLYASNFIVMFSDDVGSKGQGGTTSSQRARADKEQQLLIKELREQLQVQRTKLAEMEENQQTPPPKKRSYVYKDAKEAWTTLDHWCNTYAREDLFHQVKFITSDSQLDSYEDEGSIGHAFLTKYTSCHQQPDNMSPEFRIQLWTKAKDRIRKAINRKRGSICSNLKKQFTRKFN